MNKIVMKIILGILSITVGVTATILAFPYKMGGLYFFGIVLILFGSLVLLITIDELDHKRKRK